MNKSIQLSSPKGLPPVAGYSHIAVVQANETIYISGQIALDLSGQLVGQGDLALQTKQVFENIQTALTSVNLTFKDVVKLTYFLKDITQMSSVRTVRDQYVNVDQPPTSSAFEVSRLVHEDLLIEVEAIAVR